jgi:acetyl esterase
MHEANLSLRGPGGSMRARVSWPVPVGSSQRARLLVFFPGAGSRPDSIDVVCRGLSDETRVVVLSVREPATEERWSAAFEIATTAIDWAADHAFELGARLMGLLVGGTGRGAGLAAASAIRARELGWPVLSRQVLIDPELDESRLVTPSLAGVAPATVMGELDDPTRRYVTRLRAAGVEVDDEFASARRS